MRSELCAGLAFLALLAGAALPGLAGEPLERVLADVDGQPVLLSEVRLLEGLRGLERATALEAVIDARLMYREAARVPQAAVSDLEAARACKTLRARADEQAQLPEAELCALARREATIVKYVDFRFAPQVRADGRSGDEVSAALDARIEEWVKELRAAAEIRYNP